MPRKRRGAAELPGRALPARSLGLRAPALGALVRDRRAMQARARRSATSAAIVPADETLLCVFESATEELVREIYARAGIPFDRMGAVIGKRRPTVARSRRDGAVDGSPVPKLCPLARRRLRSMTRDTHNRRCRRGHDRTRTVLALTTALVVGVVGATAAGASAMSAEAWRRSHHREHRRPAHRADRAGLLREAPRLLPCVRGSTRGSPCSPTLPRSLRPCSRETHSSRASARAAWRS